MDTLLEKYTQLNDSFIKRKLTYHLGVEAGFFSEYNNMILAMLYCLENKIQFKLYSKDANFRHDKGWKDYFLPFCQEDNFAYQRHNQRVPVPSKKNDPRVILHHIFRPNTFLTFELWDAFRDRNREKQYFHIPELGIDGNLQEACQVLIQLTWRYNEVIKNATEKMIASLKLPKKYIGFHIRSGDKIKEIELFNISQYVEKAKLHSHLKTAFILTDDYRIVESFQNQFKEWNIYTLCGQEEKGYFFDDFLKNDKETIKNAYIKLFASVDILSKAEVFVGTFTSNPGMFLGMRMNPSKVYGIDLEQWQIW
ncbi:MAG: hypothetical protein LBT25_04030 [Candidatus Symbiothrix sp.]|jgi:hypothetical protein|nr:hypothetical protein [Candidatus Symbiothrix sp.]